MFKQECEECTNKDERIRELEEFACRAKAAFYSIRDKIPYSAKSKLETDIFGSFSCPHDAENARLREAVEWACRQLDRLDNPEFKDKLSDELRRRAGLTQTRRGEP